MNAHEAETLPGVRCLWINDANEEVVDALLDAYEDAGWEREHAEMIGYDTLVIIGRSGARGTTR